MVRMLDARGPDMDRLTTALNTRPARVVLVVVSLVAALSIGGAFLAGIALVPLLVLVAGRASRLGAWGYGILAGVLAAEVAWGLTYVAVGESGSAIWLVPLIAGATTVIAAVVANGGRTNGAQARR